MRTHSITSSVRLVCLVAMSISMVFPPSLVFGAAKIDDFTTSPGWVDDETGAEVLVNFDVGGTTYVNPQISTTSATSSGIWLWGNAATDPGGAIQAITDNRLDSGTLGTGVGIDFDLGATLSATDQIFVFFNSATSVGFQEQPATIEALDSGGSVLGSVAFPTLDFNADAVGRADFIRSDGPALNDRNVYGLAAGASEFGVTLADIHGIRFTGPATADFQMVGFASEAPPFAEWAATGGGSWNTGSNWSTGSAPAGIPVVFGSSITSNATVSLDGDQSVTDLTFNDNNSYTLSGNTLAIVGNVSTQQGTHTIASNFELAGGPITLTSSAGANLNITGTTSGLNDAAATIILDGAGGGSIGAIRDNNNLLNALDGTDNIAVVKRGSGTWTIGPGTTVLEDIHGLNTTIEEGTLRINGTGSDGELRSPVIDLRAGATLDTSEFTQYTLQLDQRLQGAGTVNTGSGDLRVSGGATIAPGDSGIGTLDVVGDLTIAGGLGAATDGSLIFELSSTSGGANDQIAVTGDVTTSSNGGSTPTTVSIVPTESTLDSSYELITFGGNYSGGGATDFAIDASLQTRFTQSISVDTDSVNLNITGSNANLVWNGNVNDTWDVNSTQNWTNGGADVFFDLDNTLFDDTAAGSGTVDLVETVQPASVTFNNATKDYTVSGAGSIAGAGSVTKSGTGRATISTANSYSGTTTITGGVLHAANNEALGSTAGGTIVNGGALDITGSNIAGETVSIQGDGSDGRGALITDGLDSLAGASQQISDVVMTGNATIGAYSDEAPGATFNVADYGWALNPDNVGASTWQGNGHTLTKKGRGTVVINGVGEMNNPTINVEQGTLNWSGTTTATGSAITVGNGVDPISDTASGSAALSTFYNDAGPGSHNMNLVLQGGTFGHSTSNFANLSLNGTVVNNDVTGNDDIDNSISSFSANGNIGTLTIPVGITGTGDLRLAGNAPLVLEGNNTYTGRTEVTGDVRLSGSGQLSGTSRISVVGPAASLDVTAVGGLTTSGGQDVSIEASEFRGNLTLGSGSTLTSTSDVANNRAPLLTGNVVVQSGATLELNTGQGTSVAGTDAFIQDNNTIGTGFRYIAFEAENPTTYNENSNFNWATVTDATALTSSNPAGNSIRADGDLDSSFSTGNDDTIQYDMVFTEPGTYTWYTRARGENGGADSFFGPSQDANTANPSVGPEGGMSRYLGFTFGSGSSVQGDTLKDAEGVNGTTADYDWVRSDRTGDATVDFEEIVVTAADVAAGRVFSIAFEPRQVGARFDKMALVATDEFVGLTDADLDGVAENTTQFFTPPTPDLAFIIDGDLTLEASGTMEIDLRSLTDFDNANVMGIADLAGTLAISLDGGYVPAINDTFDILTADTLIDSGLSLGGPAGSGFSLSTANDTLTLTFTGLVGTPGDADGDGDVDGADFLLLQRTNPAGIPDWVANYPTPLSASSASSAIPEPASLVLLCLAGLGLLNNRRRA